MQIKIDNTIFNCNMISTQLTIGSHATILISFDLSTFPEYENQLIKIYESGKVFTVVSSKFESKGTKIKTLDIDFTTKKIEISLHADLLNQSDIILRRDESIDNILSKNF